MVDTTDEEEDGEGPRWGAVAPSPAPLLLSCAPLFFFRVLVR